MQELPSHPYQCVHHAPLVLAISLAERRDLLRSKHCAGEPSNSYDGSNPHAAKQQRNRAARDEAKLVLPTMVKNSTTTQIAQGRGPIAKTHWKTGLTKTTTATATTVGARVQWKKNTASTFSLLVVVDKATMVKNQLKGRHTVISGNHRRRNSPLNICVEQRIRRHPRSA